MEPKNPGTNELIHKKETVKDVENNLMVTRGKVWRDKWEIKIDIHMLIYIK